MVTYTALSLNLDLKGQQSSLFYVLPSFSVPFGNVLSSPLSSTTKLAQYAKGYRVVYQPIVLCYTNIELVLHKIHALSVSMWHCWAVLLSTYTTTAIAALLLNVLRYTRTFRQIVIILIEQ